MSLYSELTALFANHCDFVEIDKLGGKLWLKTCWNRNTARDREKDIAEGRESGQWVDETGTPRDWDYVYREVVASGEDEATLLKDAQDYHRILGMTIEDYLLEQAAKEQAAKEKVI